MWRFRSERFVAELLDLPLELVARDDELIVSLQQPFVAAADQIREQRGEELEQAKSLKGHLQRRILRTDEGFWHRQMPMNDAE